MGKLISKLIMIEEKDKKYLDKKAKEKSMTANQLIRLLIREYVEKEG